MKDYERVEVTFSKKDEEEKELFKYLEKASKIYGKGRYIKKLIYDEMLKHKGSK